MKHFHCCTKLMDVLHFSCYILYENCAKKEFNICSCRKNDGSNEFWDSFERADNTRWPDVNFRVSDHFPSGIMAISLMA